MSEILTPNAERALLFEYVLAKGLPTEEDNASSQMAMFGRISGLSEAEVCAAYAELEDKGMVEK